MLLNLHDYAVEAKNRIPAGPYEYLAGGVADNLALNDNRQAWNRLRLLPKVLVDVSNVSTQTHLAGQHLSCPVVVAPAAAHKLAHPDGELATARAAKRAETIQILSTMSTTPVEDVTAVGHNVWFQLYTNRDRKVTEALVQRAQNAGCKALVLTVDLPLFGLRENLIRAGFFLDPSTLPHLSGFIDPDPSLSWEIIAWLRSISNLPIWVKGVLRADDAKRAIDAGVSGIMVSNHGGRQLDTAITGIDALPAIAKAVAGQVEITVDGGIERGTDVLKALALGANAVLVGRAPLWGLAVDGEDGAFAVLDILRTELSIAMALCGFADIKSISADVIG